MHPKFTNTAVIAQKSGQFNFVDVDNTALNHLYHVTMPSETSVLSQMTISPSGEAIAFADSEAIVHVWGRGTNDAAVQFSEYPTEIEWPHIPQEKLPYMDINDPESPLSSVGMPYYTSQLLSVWPSHMTFEVGQQPQRLDEKVLKTMTKRDWYLYGRWNAAGRRRYQVDKPERAEELPRFRSQVEKERALAGEEEDYEKVVGRFEGGEGGVPNYYKEVEIKYSKFGVDDFDFGYKFYGMWLMTDITILLPFQDWKRTLQILMPILYYSFIILRRRYDCMHWRIPRRRVGFHFVHYVNLAFCFRISSMQVVRIVKRPISVDISGLLLELQDSILWKRIYFTRKARAKSAKLSD